MKQAIPRDRWQLPALLYALLEQRAKRVVYGKTIVRLKSSCRNVLNENLKCRPEQLTKMFINRSLIHYILWISTTALGNWEPRWNPSEDSMEKRRVKDCMRARIGSFLNIMEALFPRDSPQLVFEGNVHLQWGGVKYDGVFSFKIMYIQQSLLVTDDCAMGLEHFDSMQSEKLATNDESVNGKLFLFVYSWEWLRGAGLQFQKMVNFW